ncbi:hypothetical protein GCM10022222_21210 [Amycolatopsis ultiminotia]|uniref:Uncharacterized protein n=1 Tax=Amycolatopsis ultiminotia TaxID=543629 RepID=A0ABP6VKA2_9PSEU
MTTGQNDPAVQRITLSRSAMRQLVREARARGYVRGRRDEHQDTVRRLAGRTVGEVEFVQEAMARQGETFTVIWNVLGDRRANEGGDR